MDIFYSSISLPTQTCGDTSTVTDIDAYTHIHEQRDKHILIQAHTQIYTHILNFKHIQKHTYKTISENTPSVRTAYICL